MEYLTDYQQAAIKKFVAKTGKIIENGYAYAFAHPNSVKLLKCEAARIKEIEKILNDRPLACNQKMMRDAYIRYIMMVIKYGLKYIESNPELYGDFRELQEAINGLSEEQSCPGCIQVNDARFLSKQQNRQRQAFNKTYTIKSRDSAQQNCQVNNKTYTIKAQDSTEDIFCETFHQLEDLCGKIDKIRARVNSINKPKVNRLKCRLQRSQDGMKRLNEELTEKLEQMREERRQRIRNAESSDCIPSEEVLNYNNFAQPLIRKQKPVRAGPIQRNIVIPVRSDNPPRIKPKYYYNRSRNGEVTLDLKLDFEDGVMMNNKLANGIYIKSNLPAQAFWGRR